MIHVISVSGGKDSTALWLWAIRTGLAPLMPLFCDTKWESSKDGISTYGYLDDLERRLGPIRRVVSEGFEERTRRGGTFPSRVRKWCSPELKVAMCAAELQRIRAEYPDEDVEVLVGFRKEESLARAQTTEREWMPDYDCEVWRPILDWTIQDVIAEHRRAGVPMNPLLSPWRRARRLLAVHPRPGRRRSRWSPAMTRNGSNASQPSKPTSGKPCSCSGRRAKGRPRTIQTSVFPPRSVRWRSGH